jgi:hypothetical protein
VFDASVVSGGDRVYVESYMYIYIYIERERERSFACERRRDGEVRGRVGNYWGS